jgi:hypothetical protein
MTGDAAADWTEDEKRAVVAEIARLVGAAGRQRRLLLLAFGRHDEAPRLRSGSAAALLAASASALRPTLSRSISAHCRAFRCAISISAAAFMRLISASAAAAWRWAVVARPLPIRTVICARGY